MDKPTRTATAAILLTVVLVCGLISSRYFQFMLIRGDSMDPTFHNMQLVLLDKRADEYRAGDVVAFRCESLSSVLVKRVVAVPGDKVQIIDGTLVVNGEASPYYKKRAFVYAGALADAVVADDGEYIVIGDNVDESKDSRYPQIGAVPLNSIIGKILANEPSLSP